METKIYQNRLSHACYHASGHCIWSPVTLATLIPVGSFPLGHPTAAPRITLREDPCVMWDPLVLLVRCLCILLLHWCMVVDGDTMILVTSAGYSVVL